MFTEPQVNTTEVGEFETACINLENSLNPTRTNTVKPRVYELHVGS